MNFSRVSPFSSSFHHLLLLRMKARISQFSFSSPSFSKTRWSIWDGMFSHELDDWKRLEFCNFFSKLPGTFWRWLVPCPLWMISVSWMCRSSQNELWIPADHESIARDLFWQPVRRNTIIIMIIIIIIIIIILIITTLCMCQVLFSWHKAYLLGTPSLPL